MASPTVQIYRCTGNTGSTQVAVQGYSFNDATDDINNSPPVATATDPVAIPASGTNYGWWMSFQAKVTANPVPNTVSNISVYGGSAPTGWQASGTTLDLQIGKSSSYTQAVTGGTNTGQPMTNYSGLSNQNSSFNYTSSAPLNLGGSVSNVSPVGAYLVAQVYVGANASLGQSGVLLSGSPTYAPLYVVYTVT